MLELEVFLDGMETEPDLLCFSEHWMTPEQDSYVKINKYKLVSSYSRRDMQHGGVCIFGKTGLQLESDNWIIQKSVEGSIECAGVSFPCRALVVCIYRRGLGSFEVFMEKLEDILEHIRNKYRQYKVIITGDFNLNLLVKNEQNNVFLDLMLGYNFVQTIFSPTREVGDSRSLIDNAFVNFNEFDASVVETALSDHHAQTVCFQCELNVQSHPKVITKRVFSKNKLHWFRNELLAVDWDPILECDDVNTSYFMFSDKIKCLINVIFPEKKYAIKTRKNNWITTGIKKSCKTKRKLYLKKRQGKVSNQEYNKYDKILKKVILNAKKISNSDFILKSENKTKATWSLVRDVSQNTGKVSILNSFDEKYGDPKTIVNRLNKYFVSSCPDSMVVGGANVESIPACRRSVFFHPTSGEEVVRCIKGLKNKKSVGEDRIPVSVLKETAEVIAQPLEHIVNLMFLNGVFPDDLKHAQVRALYKKGSRSDEKNYRPVSLLSNVSKIFEKIIYSRLMSFIENNGLLTDQQNGFRKKRSTINAIYQALSKVLNSLNNDKTTLAMLVDLSKAFDSVNHGILLQKLEKYGVRGVALRLIGSYLSNRTQNVVEYNEEGILVCSEKIEVKRGVPQGSILGPLFYILYTNELPNVTGDYMVLYADDTTLIFAEDDRDILLQRVDSAVRSLNEYFVANDLLMNVNKTQTLLFSNRNNDAVTTAFEGNDFVSAENILFLGIHVDRRLDWRCHIDYLAKSMAKYCYALRVIADSVSEMAALSAYFAYIHSRMGYGIIFWGNSSDVNRILVLQKRCLRTMYKMNQMESCKYVFIEKKILTVISLYIYESFMFVYDNSELFRNCERHHTHDTRHKSVLLPEKCKYTYIQKNVHCNIIKIFNSFPIRLRELPKNKIKMVLKQFLISRAFYSMQEFYADESKNML